MKFRNSKHNIIFTDTIRKKNKMDYALMSALYLLTEEFALWQTVKRYVTDNSIDFKSLHPVGISENGYTLLCAAKDLYLGTDYLAISDLADTQLIPPRMFALICNVIAIRRFELSAIHFEKRSDKLHYMAYYVFLTKGKLKCLQCRACEKKCPQKIKISDELQRIHNLFMAKINIIFFKK